MVLTVSFVISPVIGLGCHRRFALLQNLTPASRRQDHTTSPSAPARFVKRAISVHRIPPPTSVTIAKRPSEEAGCELRYSCFYPAVKSISENQKLYRRCGNTWPRNDRREVANTP